MRILPAIGLLIPIVVLTILGSCSQSEQLTEPEPDTTSPFVVQMKPAPGSHDVAPQSEVLIGFNEAMDADSAPGNISVSSGSVLELDWQDDRTLSVMHEVWPMGTRITITAGCGFQDVAGNTLNEDVSWDFFTYTPSVILLDSEPRNGDQDVPLDSQVQLVFSKPMAPETLPPAITVTGGTRFEHGYSLSGELDIWHLIFEEDLPADSEITVNISTAASDTTGNPLFSAASICFRTVVSDTGSFPRVVSVVPDSGSIDVALDAPVTISFDRDMSQPSAYGNVSLSPGSELDLDWTDSRTLIVSHGEWPEGVEVTASVGSGLESAEGVPLEKPLSWRFFTQTEDVSLLSMFPPDGATGMLVTTQVHLLFSKPMNRETLPGAIAVTSPGGIAHDFDVDGAGQHWNLTFFEDLPGSTPITVFVGTAAQDTLGQALIEAVSFSFTTGSEADTLPPEIESISPANGTSIPSGTQVVRIAFTEPIDETSLLPSVFSGQFWLALADQMNPAGWSDNHKVLTINLRTPLSPGAVFRLEVDSFADIHGNVNTEGFAWEVTVTGVAEYFPVLDGWHYMYEGLWESIAPPEIASGELTRFEKVEATSDDDFLRWISEQRGEPTHLRDDNPWPAYDRYHLAPNFVEYTGALFDDGMELSFGPSIRVLPRPVSTSTWSGTSTSSHPQVGELLIEYAGEVLAGTTDLPGPDREDEDFLQLSWLRCRKILMAYNISANGQPYYSRSDTLWYAPGVGLVARSYVIVDDYGNHTSSYSLGWAGPQEPGSLPE